MQGSFFTSVNSRMRRRSDSAKGLFLGVLLRISRRSRSVLRLLYRRLSSSSTCSFTERLLNFQAR